MLVALHELGSWFVLVALHGWVGLCWQLYAVDYAIIFYVACSSTAKMASISMSSSCAPSPVQGRYTATHEPKMVC